MSKQKRHKERCPRACAAGASDRRCYLRWGCSRVLSIAFPPDRHFEQLKKVSHGHLTVGEDKLKRSQVPDPVITASGYPLQRPVYWN